MAGAHLRRATLTMRPAYNSLAPFDVAFERVERRGEFYPPTVVDRPQCFVGAKRITAQRRPASSLRQLSRARENRAQLIRFAPTRAFLY